MNIIEAFNKGKAIELGGKVPKHIVTVVSNVFLFEDKAYKVYKSDSDFFNKSFNDLSIKSSRFQFTRNDFDWNHRLSPEIYTDLKGVILKKDSIEFVDPTDEANELVLVMNKFSVANQLIHLLVENKISLSDCYEIGKQLAERVSHLPKLEPKDTAYEDFLSRCEDVAPWVAGVEKHIPKEIGLKYLTFVKKFIEDHKEELDSKDLMGTCIDIHADNAVYENSMFLPIDSYAPKERWLHGYKFINLYRIATDIHGFLGKEGFEKILAGYKEVSKEELPREYDQFLITYCELINWPYQYMLAEKEPWRLEVAKKYEKVLSKVNP